MLHPATRRGNSRPRATVRRTILPRPIPSRPSPDSSLLRVARRVGGAVSQRTRNIRIAHGVRLLPFNFNHPIRIAEEAAVLDIISNGRVDVGIGRSTTSQELDGFNVDYERTRAEVREALDVLVKAWTDDILEYNGKLINLHFLSGLAATFRA